jgi:hypothetical protein
VGRGGGVGGTTDSTKLIEIKMELNEKKRTRRNYEMNKSAEYLGEFEDMKDEINLNFIKLFKVLKTSNTPT